jgi:tricorn protease-like protein
MIEMDGKIFDSDGRYVAYIQANAIYDLDGKKLYDLKAHKIYKLTGEFVGNFSTPAGDRRLDKATDRLFRGQ